MIRSKRVFFLLAAVLALVGFVVLSKYEDRAFMRDLDFAVTTKVQYAVDSSTHLRAAALVDNTMEGATFFASPEFTVIVTLLFFALLVWNRQKKAWNWKALVIPVALVAIVVTEVFGKSIVHHPSPPFSMIKHTTSVFPANYINDQFSYPSGHAARALFIAVSSYVLFSVHFLLRTKGKKLMALVLLVAYVGLVSISRIYLGHHWFSDVVGGLLVGASFSFMMLAALW